MSKIAQLRQKSGLTQRELAHIVGVTETTIRNYEKGRSILEWIERIIRLCKALDCQPEDLINYVEAEETGINDR
ncbi:MAG: helix-turn-helix transcriptional regulator [Prochloraceae cyanobacterium]|nr:helix-turn-helix transcriptional regulator [Prochloraceae cyanobacterium]